VVFVLRLVAKPAGTDDLNVRVPAGERIGAGAAFTAWLVARACAVQGGGELERHGALSDALWAAEHVGVGRTRVGQSAVEDFERGGMAGDAPHLRTPPLTLKGPPRQSSLRPTANLWAAWHFIVC
jgi:hypothetical protein